MEFLQVVPNALVKYLTGDFPYAAEAVSFFMAIFGAVTVATKRNKDRKMHWFHALFLSACVGFGGAIFTPWLLGRPIPLFLSDMTVPFIFAAFYLVNFTPLGFIFCETFLGRLSWVCLSTLFKAQGCAAFVGFAYEKVAGQPSYWGYDIMIVGPILFATLLGNMGPMFVFGMDGYLQNGMPWPFQQGICMASFYHFFVNDAEGIIGTTLRSMVDSVPGLRFGLSDKKFALLVLSTFMHTVAVLQMPYFLGPTFNPLNPITTILCKVFFMEKYYGVDSGSAKSKSVSAAVPQDAGEASKKKKKKKNGNKEKTN
eukprot:CAMPEP_0196804554 /NCGR_PEP_ID=MMETSP1362-20130617/4171_1 /TAXON_ID=163516 /ORGANISM="Leptocylindrus danicus, Strain CCMP1856" /LENGTH=311 /DNA_ID=CAMNT_0042176923 /DNA_START=28 /DNA_END=963 /DNA_ORIENTATION=-